VPLGISRAPTETLVTAADRWLGSSLTLPVLDGSPAAFNSVPEMRAVRARASEKSIPAVSCDSARAANWRLARVRRSGKVRARIARQICRLDTADGGADDVLAGRDAIDPESSEIVCDIRCAACADETPPAALIAHLQQLDAGALQRLAKLVEHVPVHRAPSCQRDVHAFARLSVAEIDRDA